MVSPPSFAIEQQLLKEGVSVIAGIDEAGRGALAGPLAVGMVVFPATLYAVPPHEFSSTINDSKKLTPARRLGARALIRATACHADVCLVPHSVIDSININQATALAIRRMLERAPLVPDLVIFDGRVAYDSPVPIVPVVRGDGRSFSIAAASVLAKVRRDEIMMRFDSHYPLYGFSRHKGYGTQAHRDAIRRYGYCAIHRKSYEPVRSMCADAGGDRC